jgi:hypothetical protein
MNGGCCMRFDKINDVLGTANRGNPAESGLCTLCRADCTGKCETWKSSLVGRKLLYPRDFGLVTAGANNTTHLGVSYNSLRIQGYAYGSVGLNEGMTHNPDDCIFPNVDLNTECNYLALFIESAPAMKAGSFPWNSKRKASDAVRPCFLQVVR